jgi:hypothetical protein
MHYLYLALVVWLIYHFTVGAHNYSQIRNHPRYQHRSWLSRVWLSASIPLPFGFRGRLGHRL